MFNPAVLDVAFDSARDGWVIYNILTEETIGCLTYDTQWDARADLIAVVGMFSTTSRAWK